MSIALALKGVTKQFGGLTATDDISMEVKKGEIFSIIGPNGAGKSTLFNCINGLYKVSQGSVWLNGEDITGAKPHVIARKGLSRTFQNLELFSKMTTMENLMLGRHLYMRTNFLNLPTMLWKKGLAARDEIRHREKVEEIIDLLDLQSVRNRYTSQLPYGQQKVVELGRALATEPSVLLLDEPAAGLNLEEKDELVFWISDIRRLFDITILIIEHNMRLVTAISDRIMALNFGKSIITDKPEAVIKHPEVVKAYLG